MQRESRMREVTPVEARQVETLNAILKILDRVCKRLGFAYLPITAAHDASRVGLIFARSYDLEAIASFDHYKGDPHLTLEWGNEDGIRTVDYLPCGDDSNLYAVRVEVTVHDPNFNRELLDRLWKSINSADKACLTARWSHDYLERVVRVYVQAIGESVEHLGWTVDDGYWSHADMIQTNDYGRWETTARPPLKHRVEAVPISIFPDSIGCVIHMPDLAEQQKKTELVQVGQAISKACRITKRELEERPLWARDEEQIAMQGAEIPTSQQMPKHAGTETQAPEYQYPTLEQLRKYYRGASLERAKEILEVLPDAYKSCTLGKKRWSAGFIKKYTTLQSPNTVTKYLRAFWMNGIREWKGAPNPYRPRKHDESVLSE